MQKSCMGVVSTVLQYVGHAIPCCFTFTFSTFTFSTFIFSTFIFSTFTLSTFTLRQLISFRFMKMSLLWLAVISCCEKCLFCSHKKLSLHHSTSLRSTVGEFLFTSFLFDFKCCSSHLVFCGTQHSLLSTLTVSGFPNFRNIRNHLMTEMLILS